MIRAARLWLSPDESKSRVWTQIIFPRRKYVQLEVAVMLKNHTGAGQCTPEKSSSSSKTWSQLWNFHPKKGLGVRRESAQLQDGKSLSGLLVDPCGLRAAAALSPTLCCDIGTPWAQPELAVLSPSHSSEQSLLLRNLGALRLAARDCAALGARMLPPWKGKGFRETVGQVGQGRDELAVSLFALSDAALAGVMVTARPPQRHTATAKNRAGFLSRVQNTPSIPLVLQQLPKHGVALQVPWLITYYKLNSGWFPLSSPSEELRCNQKKEKLDHLITCAT